MRQTGERITNSNFDFLPREPLRLTSMRAMPEGEVLTWANFSMNVKLVWIREYVGVTVAGSHRADDTLAGFDILEEKRSEGEYYARNHSLLHTFPPSSTSSIATRRLLSADGV